MIRLEKRMRRWCEGTCAAFSECGDGVTFWSWNSAGRERGLDPIVKKDFQFPIEKFRREILISTPHVCHVDDKRIVGFCV